MSSHRSGRKSGAVGTSNGTEPPESRGRSQSGADKYPRRERSVSASPPRAASPAPPSLRRQAGELALCVGGIYVFFIWYAILQEDLTTTPTPDGKRFTYPLFLMLVQCVCNAALVWPLLQWQQRGVKSQPCGMRAHHYALIAFTYATGMQTSYLALEYISFPTQVLVKSCKMLPVMALGAVVFRQKYTATEYMAVLLISGGIYAFFAFKPDASSTAATGSGSTWTGVALSMLSLLADGITGAAQDHYVHQFRPSSERLMYEMNRWAVAELLLACVLTGQGWAGLQFVLAHGAVARKLLLFGLVSGLGQLFVFRTITRFGALALAVATSTRKFFTILASVLCFGHVLAPAQWVAVAAVFGGLFADIAHKSAKARHRSHKAAAQWAADAAAAMHGREASVDLELAAAEAASRAKSE